MSGVHMNQDLLIFCGSVVLLIVYLVFSAKTEMGTNLFASKKDNDEL